MDRGAVGQTRVGRMIAHVPGGSLDRDGGEQRGSDRGADRCTAFNRPLATPASSSPIPYSAVACMATKICAMPSAMTTSAGSTANQ